MDRNEMRYWTEEKRVESSRPLLETVTALGPRAATAQPEKPKPREKAPLSDAAVQLLVVAALEVGATLVTLYRRLGWHDSQGTRPCKELESQAMVKRHQLARVGSGGKPVVLEVLEAGAAELSRRGIPLPRPRVGRGGFLHDVYAQYIATHLRQQGATCRFEHSFGEKSFDVCAWMPDGTIVGYEVITSGSGAWNAQQSVKAAEVAGVDRVVVACETKPQLTQLTRALANMDAEPKTLDKIELTLLGKYVSAAY